MCSFKDVVVDFMEAVYKAETTGEHEFTCPLCGGKAHCGRSDYNGHLLAVCYNCKVRIMQ